MKVEYIYLKSILILSNSLFEKLSTHLSMLKAQNPHFAKHAQPQTEKPRAYKKKSVYILSFGSRSENIEKHRKIENH